MLLNHTTVYRASIDSPMGRWSSVTYMLNNLNRSRGMDGGYPCALPRATRRHLDVTSAIEHCPISSACVPAGAAQALVDMAAVGKPGPRKSSPGQHEAEPRLVTWSPRLRPGRRPLSGRRQFGTQSSLPSP